nr:type II toxin-antitoxin system HicB family antitoxin [uncultured Methanospirillum sp.]
MTEDMVSLNIRKLDEGTYLATSEAIPSLIAEGRSIVETIEISQDVARKIIESNIEHGDPLPPCMSESIKLQDDAKGPDIIQKDCSHYVVFTYSIS